LPHKRGVLFTTERSFCVGAALKHTRVVIPFLPPGGGVKGVLKNKQPPFFPRHKGFGGTPHLPDPVVLLPGIEKGEILAQFANKFFF